MATIYKICTQSEWNTAVEQNWFIGSADDLRDGFIHFSTMSQLAETIRRHFSNRHDLLVVAVNVDILGDALKLEPSRGGELFPHLYGPLKVESALYAAPLAIDPDGTVQLPEQELQADR